MKRTISLALGAVLMCSAVSCSEKKDDTSSPPRIVPQKSSISIITDETAVYRRSDIPQPEGIGAVQDIRYITETDGIIILGTCGICLTDSTFGVYDTFPFDNESGDPVTFAHSADRIYIIKSHTDYTTDITTNSLLIYAMNGDLISAAEIVAYDETLTDIVNGAEYVDDEKLLIRAAEKCFFIDMSGNIIGELESDRSIGKTVRLSDGRLAAVLSDKSETQLREIDISNMTIGEKIMDIPDTLSGIAMDGAGDDLIYIVDNNAVYGVRSDNSAHELLNMTRSGFSHLTNITPLAEDSFLAVENGRLILLSQRDVSEIADIQELTLAVASPYDSISGYIASFNSQSNKYRINVVDYSVDHEYSLDGLDEARKALEMDIISGNIPDMVWLSPNEADKLSSKGAFADLYDLMASDKTYSRDAFLPNYLEACEKNGHLYSVQPSFQIKTVAAKRSRLDKKSLTAADIIKVYESLPEGAELFDSANNNYAVLSYVTNSGMNFVDMSDFNCSFDSEEFIELLRFADMFPDVDDYDFSAEHSCRKDTALLSNMYIQDFRDFNAQKCAAIGEEMAFVGAPSNDGSGSVIILGDQYAIMENSPKKEGCWEFIRTTFYNTFDGIPVTKNAFETAKKEATERQFYINENGEKEYIREEVCDWSTSEILRVDPMTAEEADYYSDFVLSINKASSVRSDTAISRIMSEETSAFFAGECTAEQCGERIQDRVTIYLSEQS